MDSTFNWRIKKLEPGTQIFDLTVIKLIEHKSKDGSLRYLCRCVCGKEVVLQRSSLNGNRTKSCGCRQARAQQKEPGEVSYKVLYGSYRNRAKKDNRLFELTFEQFKDLIIQNCVYCDAEPKEYNTYINDGNKSRAIQPASIDRAWIKANGVDRINPKQGYILTNCDPCCAQCNYTKSDYTKEEFLVHNERIHQFQQKKKSVI